MNFVIMIAIDLIAISVMTFGLYFPRHRRRDLVAAFVGVNVGVVAVSVVLGSSTVGAGLGLGLFGVLSIIRLRSSEIAQHEVAYYFAALAMGLITGLSANSGFSWLAVGLVALVLAVMVVADSPRLLQRYRQQAMTLDGAFTDEAALVAHLERMLAAHVHSVTISHVDLVNDTTTVDVRFRLPNVRRPGVSAVAERDASTGQDAAAAQDAGAGLDAAAGRAAQPSAVAQGSVR